ncbi:MAG: hypothetical protein WAN75_44695, partial [Xanthobacteraceae bacterium]
MNSTPAGAPLTSSTSAAGIGAASAGDILVASATTATRIFVIIAHPLVGFMAMDLKHILLSRALKQHCVA